MHKVWAVIRREYLERVRTKAFVIGTFLFPLVLGLFWALPLLLARRDTGAKKVAVVDATTGGVGDRVVKALSEAVDDKGRNRYVLTVVPATGRVDAVRDSLVQRTGLSAKRAEGETFDGVLVLDDARLAEGKSLYLGTNVTSFADMRILDGQVERTIHRTRLLGLGIDSAQAAEALARVDLQTEKVNDGRRTGESGDAGFFLAYAMDFLLYMGLILYGMQVMGSIVEEKTTRIAEVLVSSLTPFQLMLGKVLGVGLVGLTQMGIWATTAMLLTSYATQMAAVFGMGDPTSGVKLPTVSPQLLVVFLLFFVLGFLLFASAYAAVGAMCNSTQETQQANTPVTMTIAVGFVLMFALLGEPNGTLARVLTFVPLVSPFVVPVRYSISPMPVLEVVGAALALVVGLVAITWVAARIYRIGILSYGKRPTLGELWRWVRTA
ncbi:MAG: ABC transporter permease [Gemmatimonadales bacterium]|nr:ABC transporter permease [Gemmatimonadales bacterium]